MESMALRNPAGKLHRKESGSLGLDLPWRLRLRRRYIKLKSWEYWPIKWVYFFPSVYFLYLGLRSRSLLFFSASNPAIETGGMFFESKWKIFLQLPETVFPKTLFFGEGVEASRVLQGMRAASLDFPVIAKPDRGERGWGVRLLRNREDLGQYLRDFPIDFLLQAYIGFPEEYSLFYVRHPDSETGKITSLTRKTMLGIEGDGQRTTRELILANDRALLQYEALDQTLGAEMDYIPALGEQKLLVPYGNHCRGAEFTDACAQINPALTRTIDRLAKSFEDFYFGRFDLRCQSLDDLAEGRNFSILEVNGAGAEPAHIYHPGYSFFKGQQVLVQHFKMMYDIAKANHRKGVPYLSFKEYRDYMSQREAYRQKSRMV